MIVKEIQGLLSARDWNRTSTFLRTADFESAASTNSATRAFLNGGRQYYNFIQLRPPSKSFFLPLLFTAAFARQQ